MRYKILLLLFSLPASYALYAQSESWDAYLAQYEKGVGSTLLNMSLKSEAPIPGLGYVLITGVTFTGCQDDGMPLKKTFEDLYKIADSVKAVVEHFTGKNNKMAGTFTYQCQRLDYYYISDTSLLRKELSKMYASSFSSFEPYINIKPDQKWEGYLTFLYPNEESYEYMQNEKVVLKLHEAGDDLIKERLVDHWAYFKSDEDRNCFIKYVTQNKFKIEEKEKTTSSNNKFKLHFSRVEKVDIPSITKTTLALRKQAALCGGDYDGWETFVVKN
ncbi:MAG: DUF695 domain-containing protein [Ferruginibacter sp.]